MSRRVLVIEDEPSLLKGLLDVLEVKGYKVESATRGDEGLKMALQGGHSLILLDIMLPGVSGLDILHQLRAAGNRTPIILLTAKDTEMDKVLGFELGVDDYVTKPFSLLELLGRITAVLRRAAPAGQDEVAIESLTFGAITIDLKRYTAQRSGALVDLPARAFDLLRVLAARRGQVVDRDALIDEVWGKDEFINQRTVNNLVVKLRQAIEEDPANPRYLKTIHGLGYRLDGLP